MKRRPMITLLLSVLLVAVVLVGGTMAYLVARDDAVVNSFDLADVRTEIEEPEGGSAASKTPKVKNEGASQVYVRARAVVITGEGSSVPVSEQDLNIRYNVENYESEDSNWENNKDTWWFDGEDGWYYYNVPLNQNDETEPLFDGVKITTVWENPQSVKFDIYVYHESVVAKAKENGPAAFQ